MTRAHRYDPDFNPEFFHFCEIQGTAPVAARPRSPKDKNLIENVLGVFWRWARPLFRVRVFFSLGELNSFMRELLEDFNNRIQRKYGQSRRQKFQAGEQNKLLPLPSGEYRVGSWKKHKLHADCHIQVGHNFYSAPYQYRNETLDVRITPQTIEIFHRLERIAAHAAMPLARLGGSRGGYRTIDAHLPPAHQALKEETPQQILEIAQKVGPSTATVISNLIERSRHPLMYLRRALGITRLAKRYSNTALEEACTLMVSLGIEQPRLKDLEELITNEKARKHTESASKAVVRKPNPNLRGQKSWSAIIH